MATTIQINDSTKQMLSLLKEEEEVETYDEVITHLIKGHTRIPESMFGAIKEVRFTKKDKLKLHEL